MTDRVSLIVASSLFLMCSFAPLSTQAQDWAQEAEVIATIGYGTPLHIFLDSLSTSLDRSPDIRLRRSPQDPLTRPYATIRDGLYQEGVALRSASHVFVRYRFDLRDGGTRIVETIQDLHLIVRLDEMEADISILYLNLRSPLTQEVITTRGIHRGMNLKNLTTFRDLISFPNLTAQEGTAIIEMGRRQMSIEEGRQKKQLLMSFFGNQPYLLSIDQSPPKASVPPEISVTE